MPFIQPADLARQSRLWFHRLITVEPSPTGKSVLCLYVSSLDRIVRVDDDLLKQGIVLAAQYDGCTEAEGIDALCDILDGGALPSGRVTKAVHVLAALIARVKRGSQAADRVRIDKSALPVLNFLNKWFQCQPPDRQRELPGGAPAIIAQVLTQLEAQALKRVGAGGEPPVALWTTYHSKRQAEIFDESVKFLKIDADCRPEAAPIRDAGDVADPELRNYPMEFAKGTEFTLSRSDGRTYSALARGSDRVIAIAPEYRFYDETSGDLAARSASPSLPLHLLAADPWLGPACTAEVAADYRYWILGGLHAVDDPQAQASLAADLDQVPRNVTLHVEIAGPQVSAWFQQMLACHVNSVGVNIDDLASLVVCVAANDPALDPPPSRPLAPDLEREYMLQLALWLACALDQERVYIHAMALDYVVRRAAETDAMNREVVADLLAKKTVVDRARAAGLGARPDREYGYPDSTLLAYVDVCAQHAYPVTGWATLANSAKFKAILDDGWFDDTYVYREQEVPFKVAVVPVGLFRLDPGNLLFVGAGDTSSAVSFVFGCFTTAGSKRQPAHMS